MPVPLPLHINSTVDLVQKAADIALKILQFFVIIAGGLGVYFRWFRGLEASVTATIADDPSGAYLVVRIKAKNIGQRRVTLDHANSCLLIDGLNPSFIPLKLPTAEELAFFAVFRDDDWIDANESIEDVLFLKIPGELQSVAIRLKLRVVSGKNKCTAFHIVCPVPSEAKL
jgi:hypothetical protein